MKRTIKFRAFHKEKGMFDVTGWDETHVFKNTYDSPDFLENIFPLDDVILMQYTGLKDKNGIEIYEGDLLSDLFPIDEEDLSKGYHESFLPVVWCSKTLQWCVDASFAKNGSYLTSLVEYFGESLEVKGNIYENPELC